MSKKEMRDANSFLNGDDSDSSSEDLNTLSINENYKKELRCVVGK